MNLFDDEAIAVSTLLGRIRLHGANQKIALGLMTDDVQDDRVLICDGVAISTVTSPRKTEVKHVSCDTRKTY